MANSLDELLNDLVAEYARLEQILVGLTPEQWAMPSALAGWTIRDVVIHLAQTEEGVALSLTEPTDAWNERSGTLDQAVDARVHRDTTPASQLLNRWRAASRSSVAALRTADPTIAVRWAAAPLKPRTLATTRLAEHWAHALDICEPLELALQDTDRLRHIAWLGHATLPYAMELAGLEPLEVRCTLDAPSGETWTYGPESAQDRIHGSAAAFCRVGARRLAGAESGLAVSGPAAAQALSVLRNYAA